MGALPSWDGSPEIVRDVVVEEVPLGGLCVCACVYVVCRLVL